MYSSNFIEKPIDRVYFVAALQRALHTWSLRGQVRRQHQELEQYAQALEQLVERRTREFVAANVAMEMLVRDAFYAIWTATMPANVPMKMLVPEMVGVAKRFACPTFSEVTTCPVSIVSA